MSNGTSPAALDAFTDQGSEFDRWQAIEHEVWGDGEDLNQPATKKEKRKQQKTRSAAEKAEDRSGGPLLLVFLFGLGFFALLYWLVLAPASGDAPAAKEGAPAAIARVVGQPACPEVGALVSNDRYLGVEAELPALLSASQLDIEALGRLRSVDVDTAQIAAPLEFRAQLVLTLAERVQAGELTAADLRSQISPLDAQIEGAVRAMDTFAQQSC